VHFACSCVGLVLRLSSFLCTSMTSAYFVESSGAGGRHILSRQTVRAARVARHDTVSRCADRLVHFGSRAANEYVVAWICTECVAPVSDA
jgi:hypothetical protein